MQTARPKLAPTSLAGVLLLAVLAGCGSTPGRHAVGGPAQHPSAARASRAGSTAGSPSGASADTAPTTDGQAVLDANVADGDDGVKVDKLVKVTAANGKVTEVKLSYQEPNEQGQSNTRTVDGTYSKDHRVWTADSALDPAVRYRLTTVGDNGSAATRVTTELSFSTEKLRLDEQTYPVLYPNTGAKVGVAMPVILTFDTAVTNRKQIERHLAVTSTANQAGSWHWYGDKEVHFRPEKYWKPGSTVTVHANLNGVDAGGGIYGQKSTTTAFSIGRSVVTKVNLKTKQARVYLDGKLLRMIPVSGGKDGWVSRSGSKVVMQKLYTHRMTNQMIGAAEPYDLNVRYAMRVTSSGEFLHAAPWNHRNFGRRNSSHGCIGMSTSDAHWLFHTISVGSPVLTTGTSRGLQQGNGWADWNLSYQQYKKGSAL